jgi:hypothetical protein
VQPVNDPRLRIEWLRDGLPLASSSRIRTIHEFGYVALEFAHLLAEDTAEYTCRAVNDVGEATTTLAFECHGKRNLYLESQHESSWVRFILYTDIFFHSSQLITYTTCTCNL